MAEVTLSDYLAHLFQQIAGARDMADRHSKELALLYAKDEVLKHFSVPRFKIAKMDLTIPVLVSDVRISSLAKFRLPLAEFVRLLLDRLIEVALTALRNKAGGRLPLPIPGSGVIRTDGIDALIAPLHEQLVNDPASAEKIAEGHWTTLVQRVLSLNGLGPADEPKDLSNRLFAGVLQVIKAGITVSRPKIEDVLVNPETNVVKNGGGDKAVVFTIQAQLAEEGLFVRSVRDEAGAETRVVEFE